MIDESTAVGSAQKDLRWQRFGYLAAGIGVFVVWNASTVLGISVLGGADELIDVAGIDATIPAAFLALLWPRLADPRHRLLAIAGAIIALLSAPFLSPGLPILASILAVLLLRPWQNRPDPDRSKLGTAS